MLGIEEQLHGLENKAYMVMVTSFGVRARSNMYFSSHRRVDTICTPRRANLGVEEDRVRHPVGLFHLMEPSERMRQALRHRRAWTEVVRHEADLLPRTPAPCMGLDC